MRVGGNQDKQGRVAGGVPAEGNTSGDNTVKSSPGTLWRLLVGNTAAAIGTVIVKDGATERGRFVIPANDTRVLEFGCRFSTSIVVNLSAATLFITPIFD